MERKFGFESLCAAAGETAFRLNAGAFAAESEGRGSAKKRLVQEPPIWNSAQLMVPRLRECCAAARWLNELTGLSSCHPTSASEKFVRSVSQIDRKKNSSRADQFPRIY